MTFENALEDVARFPGQMLASMSAAEFIAQMALGIADAQSVLDSNSVKQTLALANETIAGLGKSPLELGFVPAFYHFQEAELDMSLSVSMHYVRDEGFNIGGEAGAGTESGPGGGGSLTITVVQGESKQATALVVLKKNDTAGTLTVGANTIEIVPAATQALHVELKDGIYQTAQELATLLRGDNTVDHVPEVGRVATKAISKGITSATTNNAAAFDVHPTWVRVQGKGAQPARAWYRLDHNVGGDLRVALSSHSAEVNLRFESGTAQPLAGFAFVDTGANLGAMVTDAISTIKTAATGNSRFDTNGTKAFFSEGAFHSNVLFGYDADAVDSAWFDELDELATFLNSCPSVQVWLEGHTDTDGSDQYNMGLGDRRSKAVKTYLTQQGVPAGRLHTRSFGEKQPGSITTAADLRRVEVKLKDDHDSYVIQVETDTATGNLREWDVTAFSQSITPTPASGGIGMTAANGSLLGHHQGIAPVLAAAGDHVTVNGTRYTVAGNTTTFPEFAAAGGAVATATAMVDTINGHTADGVSAYSVGNVVMFLGPGSEIQLTLHAKQAGEPGNGIVLTSDGQTLVINKPFEGGADAGAPKPQSATNDDGDTITLGQKVFELVEDNPTGKQFELGIDSSSTAANLAAAIDSDPKWTASVVDGETDTVKASGPSGTVVKTSNETMFKLSAKMTGGPIDSSKPQGRKWANFAITADYHYKQKFDVSASGNSRIKARLVSVPPPASFIQSIDDYIKLLNN